MFISSIFLPNRVSLLNLHCEIRTLNAIPNRLHQAYLYLRLQKDFVITILISGSFNCIYIGMNCLCLNITYIEHASKIMLFHSNNIFIFYLENLTSNYFKNKKLNLNFVNVRINQIE